MACVSGGLVAFEMLGVAKSGKGDGTRGRGRCCKDRDDSCNGLGFDSPRLMQIISSISSASAIQLESRGSRCRRGKTYFYCSNMRPGCKMCARGR